jgi:L-2-hydroxyglutarate oxidase LhgO
LSEYVEVVVVGAGVVGLAVARAQALAGRSVIVVERHARIGEETSSRNSGVIHSGIYYPEGSLKARFCVRGRELLYDYCARRNVNHSRCGKLIVAQPPQVAALHVLRARAIANGVPDLEWLTGAEARALEPEVRCEAALYSPSTGIVDVHEYLNALVADLEAAGGHVVLRTRFVGAAVRPAGIEVRLEGDGETTSIVCGLLVNSAGLGAVDLLRRIDAYPAATPRTAYYAKGSYFVCRGARPFTHLIYPMPNEAGLGVHATLDLDGTTRFGPDVEWVDEPDYRVEPSRAAVFYEAIREYWPGLRDGALQPGYAGIRPKLVGPGVPAADFMIETQRQHGVPGLVNLLGVESPGLTSALAIAEHLCAAARR